MAGGKNHPGKALLHQPGDQSRLALWRIAQAVTGGQQKHAVSLPPVMSIGNLNDVHPANLVIQPGMPGDHLRSGKDRHFQRFAKGEHSITSLPVYPKM